MQDRVVAPRMFVELLRDTDALVHIHLDQVPILLDLAFASNVRYLDDHEMYLSTIELYKTLPYAR